MIAQLLLSLLLAAMLAYAAVAARRTRLVSGLIGAAALAGIFFVWQPDRANELAHDVGIGRGADLVLYVWVVLTMLVGLNLHLRLRTQTIRTTELARALALLEAERRSDEPREAASDQPE
jgi:small membrane protein